jgi:DNA ligase (NAD+)
MTFELDPIQYLENEIQRHKSLYYEGKPEIPDSEYDELEEKLRILAPNSPVLAKVGAPIAGEKVKHDTPMLSLDKVREIQDLNAWLDGDHFVASYKMDGSSASLVYSNGEFLLAKTRGDGLEGENITPHLNFMKFPRKLLNVSEVRGEIVIQYDSFIKLSAEMARLGLEKPKSIRNIVAGILHRKSNLELCRYLEFFAYDITLESNSFHQEIEKFDTLTQAGFTTPPKFGPHPANKAPEVIKSYQYQVMDDNNTNRYPYLTDGLVFALNRIASQEDRGITAHHPKGKMAFKFQSEALQTTVQAIEVNVGRTGKLTFVGIVDPVELSGAVVQRVTLHNAKYIAEHHINVGCVIELTRSGEVIPKHQRTVTENGVYEPPKTCPKCDSPLSESKTGVDLSCTSETCPAKLFGALMHWVEVLGIDSLGETTLEKVMDRGWVEDIPDLYTLAGPELAQINGIGPVLAEKVVENIQKTRQMTLEKLLTGAGIPGAGPGVIKLITGHVPTLEALFELKSGDLANIHGIGPILARQLHESIHSRVLPLVQELLARRVEIVVESSQKNNGCLKGKTFVFTGALVKSRKELQTLVESLGGTVGSAITKNTSYLVSNGGVSTKSERAKALNVKLLTEEEFKLLIMTQVHDSK